MSKSALGRSGNTHPEVDSAAASEAIDFVADLCRVSLPDSAVERELRELGALKSASMACWPLPADIKKQIDIGSFAAKNIADWNPDLADALMRLDYSLQHDGSKIEQVISETFAVTIQESASITS